MDGKTKNSFVSKIFFILIFAIAVSGVANSDALADESAIENGMEKTTSSFWKNSDTAFHFRSYALDRDREISNDSQAWVAGGILRFLSGWWQERIQASAAVYTTQELFAPDNKPNAQLLKPIQQSFTVLGEAWASLKLTSNIELKGGRQTFDLPFINKNYARMLPDTHESYLLDVKDIYNTDWLVGYIPRIKKRNTNKFVWMSEQAGVSGGRDGTAIINLTHKWSDKTSLVVSNQNTFNVFNNSYAEFKTVFYPTEKRAVKLSVQGTYQHAIGDKLAGDITTNSLGFMLNTDYLGVGWILAGTTTAESTKILRPFGVSPSYISLIVQDFDRPGEDALMFGATYDFSKIGINNLTGFTKYAYSWTPGSGQFASPNQGEFNITFDYKPNLGSFKGFWLRLRYADLNQHGRGEGDLRDYHVILNYSLPLF